MKLRNIIPSWLANQLWGNRAKWGLEIDESDPCWIEWESIQEKFYFLSQREGLGQKINNAGYDIVSELNLDEKVVMECGPADILHCKYWKGVPSKYLIVDVRENLIRHSEKILKELSIQNESILINRSGSLPLDDHSVDVVFSFYSLEHLFPLWDNLLEIKRVLKPGGSIIGAIPTEGGLAWGFGRWLTTRRWFFKHTNINPDKLICWEHPNFCDDIIFSMDKLFTKVKTKKWPLSYLYSIDFNLIEKFHYKKLES